MRRNGDAAPTAQQARRRAGSRGPESCAWCGSKEGLALGVYQATMMSLCPSCLAILREAKTPDRGRS